MTFSLSIKLICVLSIDLLDVESDLMANLSVDGYDGGGSAQSRLGSLLGIGLNSPTRVPPVLGTVRDIPLEGTASTTTSSFAFGTGEETNLSLFQIRVSDDARREMDLPTTISRQSPPQDFMTNAILRGAQRCIPLSPGPVPINHSIQLVAPPTSEAPTTPNGSRIDLKALFAANTPITPRVHSSPSPSNSASSSRINVTSLFNVALQSHPDGIVKAMEGAAASQPAAGVAKDVLSKLGLGMSPSTDPASAIAISPQHREGPSAINASPFSPSMSLSPAPASFSFHSDARTGSAKKRGGQLMSASTRLQLLKMQSKQSEIASDGSVGDNDAVQGSQLLSSTAGPAASSSSGTAAPEVATQSSGSRSNIMNNSASTSKHGKPNQARSRGDINNRPQRAYITGQKPAKVVSLLDSHTSVSAASASDDSCRSGSPNSPPVVVRMQKLQVSSLFGK